jgi:hypothetical protein
MRERQTDRRRDGQDKHTEASGHVFKNLTGRRRNKFLFEIDLKQKMYCTDQINIYIKVNSSKWGKARNL